MKEFGNMFREEKSESHSLNSSAVAKISSDIHPIFDRIVSRNEREKYLCQVGKVFWFTGLSGSGKSTIAQAVERTLFHRGYFAQIIDGDNIRTGISSNLSFSIADRVENIRRVAEIAKLFLSAGIIPLCSFISPTHKIRALAKEIIGAEDFIEIYVKSSLETCEQRDVKGLYKKARKGEIKGFTGIDSPYEPPQNADFIIDTGVQLEKQSVELALKFISEKIKLT